MAFADQLSDIKNELDEVKAQLAEIQNQLNPEPPVYEHVVVPSRPPLGDDPILTEKEIIELRQEYKQKHQ
jgi:hypothetical protein